jgi:acyl carrier protein
MRQVSIEQLRSLLIENCVLRTEPDSILENTPLFGPGSIGLDSLDALQMTLAIEKTYGLTIPDAQTAREVLQSLGALQQWVSSRLPPDDSTRV